MSEYWNNGTVVFDRKLSPEESAEIIEILNNSYPENKNAIWAHHDSENSWIELEDYLTGRGFSETLQALADYCARHRIGISEDSIICYYGDEDGGYDFIDGELRCLDADDRALVLCPTEQLIGQLFERFKTKDRVLAEIEAWCGQKE